MKPFTKLIYSCHLRLRGAMVILLVVGASSLGSPAHAQSSATDIPVLTRIANYMESLTTLAGEFVQISPSGIQKRGEFFLNRPGRARLSYTPPDWGIIIANDKWLSVQETPNTKPAHYPISATPIALFLDNRIRIDRTPYLQSLNALGDGIELILADPNHNIAGAIHLFYNYPDISLRSWRIRDAQGQITSVFLSNLRDDIVIPDTLFTIERDNNQKRRRR